MWILAGMLIIVSVLLAQLVSQWWLLLALFVGAYLVQTGWSGNCPATKFLRKKYGAKLGDHDDIDD